MYVARERLTSDRHHPGPPDLAVAITSPGGSAARFARKLELYLRHGVRRVWVIVPETRTISIFSPGHDERTLTEDEILDGGDVLPGFTVPVAEIFAQLQI